MENDLKKDPEGIELKKKPTRDLEDILAQIDNPHKKIEELFWRNDATCDMLYKAKIVKARQSKMVKITKDIIKEGLQFIYNNQEMDQQELVDELIKLGCFFTFDDIKKLEWSNTSVDDLRKRFPNPKDWPDSYYIWYWANFIANTMASRTNRLYLQEQEMFLVPHYIEMLNNSEEK